MTSKLVRMITRKNKNVVRAGEQEIVGYSTPEQVLAETYRPSGRSHGGNHRHKVTREDDEVEEIQDHPILEVHPSIHRHEEEPPLPERSPSMNLPGRQSSLTERHSSINRQGSFTVQPLTRKPGRTTGYSSSESSPVVSHFNVDSAFGLSSWSKYNIGNQSQPFPRDGHTVNTIAGRNGEVYLFGGKTQDMLCNDLYVIDLGFITTDNIPNMVVNMTATRIRNATGTIPIARWLAASVLVGNKFIGDDPMVINLQLVFGGTSSELIVDYSLSSFNTCISSTSVV